MAPEPGSPRTEPATESGWDGATPGGGIGAGFATVADDDGEPRPFGGRIGRFRLIELLGQGGMGAVWLAEQSEPVARRVALKVMQSALLSAPARARFEGERQALARLSHPAIAQMYEAGTAGGVPWFAMELVTGESVTIYCDRRRLPLRDRIELVVAICRGVQFAHQRGILHRDLKPSNLLVTEVEGSPLPKIIDFGIAKALDEPLSDATLLSTSHIVGTPGYVSPETWSAGGTAADVDTRSDVYSLGMVLYELLAGVPPFDLDQLGLVTAVQKISSLDPPAPSRRLRDCPIALRHSEAALRSLDPEAHVAALAGDLEAIVGKAIARDRERRYESASALAADLERHLADEPILARAPSFSYRTRKFVRRNRVPVTVAALFGAALVAALAGALVESARARRSETRAAAVARFLTTTLESANPWEAGADGLTVRDMLERAVPRLETELAGSPEVHAELLDIIGSSYYHLRDFARAEELGRRALEIRGGLYGPDSLEAAASMNDLALSLPYERRADAIALLRRCIAIRFAKRGPADTSVARGQLDLAGLLADPVEREALYRSSVAIRERLDNPGPLGFSLRGLSEFLINRGRLAEAEPYLLRAREIAAPGLATERVHYYQGQLRLGQERYVEAEAEFRASLAAGSPIRGEWNVKIGEIILGIGTALLEQGRLDEAALELDRALAVFRDPRSLSLELQAIALTEHGRLQSRLGRFDEAERELVEARVLWAGLPDESTDRARADWALGALLRDRGDLERAEPLLRAAVERFARDYPPGYGELEGARIDLAELERRRGAGIHPRTPRSS